jgi:hypothetical protein
MAAGFSVAEVDSTTAQSLPYLDPAYGDTVQVKNLGPETVYLGSVDTRSAPASRIVPAGAYPLKPGESLTVPASVGADFHQTGFNTAGGTSYLAMVWAAASPQSS